MPRTPVAASPASRPRTPPLGGALAALALAMLLSSLGTSIANVALPTLADAFHAPFAHVQWVVLAYLLAVTVLAVIVGRLGDLLGRRRLLVAGTGLFAAGSLVGGLAPSLALLVLARGVQGLGAATMMVLAMALVTDALPRERTGSAVGLLGTMSAVGTALGPSLGGVLIAAVGWRAILLVNVPLGLAALLLALRFLPAERPAGRREARDLDVPGALVLAVVLAAYTLALAGGGVASAALVAVLLAVAALGTLAFLRVERRARRPLLELALLRAAPLRGRLAANAAVSTVMMATLVVGPFHLARALGLGPAATGLAMSVGPLVVALTAVPAGRVVDRLGPGAVAGAGLAAMLAGCLVLAAVPTALGVAGYLAPLVATTLGYALFQTANGAAVMRGARPERRGVIAGLLALSRNLGLITGASALGAVFAAAAGGDVGAASASAIARGTHVTFAVAGGLVGLVLAAALRPARAGA